MQRMTPLSWPTVYIRLIGLLSVQRQTHNNSLPGEGRSWIWLYHKQWGLCNALFSNYFEDLFSLGQACQAEIKFSPAEVVVLYSYPFLCSAAHGTEPGWRGIVTLSRPWQLALMFWTVQHQNSTVKSDWCWCVRPRYQYFENWVFRHLETKTRVSKTTTALCDWYESKMIELTCPKWSV